MEKKITYNNEEVVINFENDTPEIEPIVLIPTFIYSMRGNIDNKKKFQFIFFEGVEGTRTKVSVKNSSICPILLDIVELLIQTRKIHLNDFSEELYFIGDWPNDTKPIPISPTVSIEYKVLANSLQGIGKTILGINDEQVEEAIYDRILHEFYDFMQYGDAGKKVLYTYPDELLFDINGGRVMSVVNDLASDGLISLNKNNPSGVYAGEITSIMDVHSL